MSDPQTPNKLYNIPTTGSDVGTWGTPINANFSAIDSNLAGVLALGLSNSNVTLNATQSSNLIYSLTGALTANVQVIFPAVGGFYYITNATTGAFSVLLACAGAGASVYIGPNDVMPILCDGTNIINVSAAKPGDFKSVAYAGAPLGYLLCVGQTVSRLQYAGLFAAVGTTWGVGDGSTTFGVPDRRGRAEFGDDSMGAGAAGRLTSAYFGADATVGNVGGSQSDTLITANLPPYTPGGTNAVSISPITAVTSGTRINFQGGVAPAVQTLNSSSIAITGSSTFAGTPQGGTSTPFATVPPGLIAYKCIKY